MTEDDGLRYHVILTPSQRMALIDVITMVMTPPVQMQVFVDVIRQVETTPADLLSLIMDALPVTP